MEHENNENNEINEVNEAKKKHGIIMRNVAYTFTHKKEEVKTLLNEFADPVIPDDANRDKWISSLMRLLRDNKEFRVLFAELMIEKNSFREQLREKITGKRETRQERSIKVRSQRKGNEENNFCCFNGFSTDPQILAEELRIAANSTDKAELEGYIKNSQQTKNTTNMIFIGGVILAGWFVYNKWIK